jgi:hypothetical protein
MVNVRVAPTGAWRCAAPGLWLRLERGSRREGKQHGYSVGSIVYAVCVVIS